MGTFFLFGWRRSKHFSEQQSNVFWPWIPPRWRVVKVPHMTLLHCYCDDGCALEGICRKMRDIALSGWNKKSLARKWMSLENSIIPLFDFSNTTWNPIKISVFWGSVLEVIACIPHRDTLHAHTTTIPPWQTWHFMIIQLKNWNISSLHFKGGKLHSLCLLAHWRHST